MLTQEQIQAYKDGHMHPGEQVNLKAAHAWAENVYAEKLRSM